MLKYSMGVRNKLMNNVGMRELLTNCQLRLYSGPVPASPNDPIGAGILLCTLDNGSGGLNWEASVTEGTLAKALSEEWTGAVVVSGQATYFRVVEPADADDTSLSAVRVQGTIGIAGADMNITNPSLSATATQTLDYFYLTMPES